MLAINEKIKIPKKPLITSETTMLLFIKKICLLQGDLNYGRCLGHSLISNHDIGCANGTS